MNDTTQSRFDHQPFLKSLTHRPGVYRMLNAKGKVLYVGKARDLKKRVSSYFHKSHSDAKTAAMLALVADVDVTVTNTEAEALILEYNLIKRHKPRFNVILRDDKSYPYIYASTEHAFPRLQFYRGARKGKGRYFGPYPSTTAVRKTLNELQKLFQIRNCPDSYFSNRSRPCLQYQIKRCMAPCVGLISREEYAADINAAIQFLEGRNREVIDRLVERMERASERMEYELAARFRDQIARLKEIEAQQLISCDSTRDLDVVAVAAGPGVACVTVLFIRNGLVQGSRNHFPKVAAELDAAAVLGGFLSQYYLGRDAPAEIVVESDFEDREVLQQGLSERAGQRIEIRHRVRGDRARWLALAHTNAEQGLRIRQSSNQTLEQQFAALAEALKLDAAPERLECFDVSHTSGEATVASCVVYNQAGAAKAEYRRFNLEPAAAGDDYGAMNEALRRRYARIRKGEVPVPDVLFVDGGRGQLGEALTVLDELELGWIPVVAVAKGRSRKPGMEQLFLAGNSTPLILPADSPALHLVQQIRDEAHRFAITGHRQRRKKARTRSALEDIPGLGPKRRRELLKQFGGMQGVRGAAVEDLVKVHGISRSLAERIYDELHVEV
ncbi:MAG: excinuclease ABC subunit UvrC [Gammaproteobacteria bacterium]|nr:excinuclease ABC subunit UvrC [Gammaproteobacteria bacterium]MDH4254867.1 excinuclease ABC subunit UvrC [Gammaproteobacteria bacterium]MDH5310199.1 excinuclease ABC subunit UvrC [Gammaproteobacteria bacterium]